MLPKPTRPISRRYWTVWKSHHPYQTPNYWSCRLLTETTITSHGSTHHYADPATVQRIRQRLFDAPGAQTSCLSIGLSPLTFSRINTDLNLSWHIKGWLLPLP